MARILADVLCCMFSFILFYKRQFYDVTAFYVFLNISTFGSEDCLAHALSSVASHVSIKGGGDVKLIIYVHLLQG